jgi:hypothetical protein
MEVWKTIEGFGNYQVSNLGNVKSLKYGKERILKSALAGAGYPHIVLQNNKISKTRNVHQLVAEAFLNHKPNGLNFVVNHKNLIKTDNRLENLEIITQRENANRKHIKSSSQYTGVCWNKKCNKWRSNIWVNGKLKNLGLFANELEAHNAYEQALKDLPL